MSSDGLRIAPARWLAVVTTVALLYFSWYLYDWLSTPDPVAHWESRGARGRVFLLVAPICFLVSLLEARWAWRGAAVTVDRRRQMLRCRKHIGASRSIPFDQVQGLRVHRHHLEHAITIRSPLDPPVIPIRLPRDADPAMLERDLRAAVGLDGDQ